MKHVVSFSGGVCSFWTAKRVVAEHGTDDVVLLFADTKIEDEDLYRFNDDVVAHLGIPLTVVCDGRNPWELFQDEKIIGNSRADVCSRKLKRELLWRWKEQHCDREDTVVYLGLDWTEPHRLERVRTIRSDWQIEAPMIDPPLWNKQQMTAELEKLGIRTPRLYPMGFPHNNCGGFCIKAGQAHFAHLLRTMPDRYAWHEAQEQLMREMTGKNISIMRDRIGGTTTPLTLRDFRLRIQPPDAGEQLELFDRFDWGGCGCAID